jgi:hypothetical protein
VEENRMATKYQLPKKILTYVKRLELMYKGKKSKSLHEILCAASFYVREDVSYDNWDGGMTGHAIILFLPAEIMGKFDSFEEQTEITDQLTNDFRECAKSIGGEYIDSVLLELEDDADEEYSESIKPFSQPIINPDSLNIWKPGYIRLFISHRDAHKKEAAALADTLETYGVSSFVAHDNIEPMEEWQHTIRKAMQSMEIMLAFVTEDFSESFWTNQEVGFALGRGVPVIPLKLGKKAPCGFIGSLQAMPGNLTDVTDAADGLYKILAEKLGHEERLRKAAVQAFVAAADFDEAKVRFERMKKVPTMTESDVQQIVDGFPKNESLHKAFYLINKHNRLISFLENRTGKRYEIQDKSIKVFEQSPIDPPWDDDSVSF